MRIELVALAGSHVRLEPLAPTHLDGLCRAGLDPEIWRWMPVQVHTREEMLQFIDDALAEQAIGKALPFATIHQPTGAVIGSTRFGNIEKQHRRVEIGWTWITASWQRTAVNTEAKFLMLRHAFETLGCVRVEFKTDALNDRSRRALLRLGANEEGTLRRHILCSTGRIRDTVYFSVVESEWSQVKIRLEERLRGGR